MELVTFQDDVTTTRALLSKEILVGEISFQNPFSVIEKGQPIKVIGLSYAKVPFVYFGRGDVKQLKDVEGKTSGIGSINDFNHQLQLAVMRKYNIDHSKVTFVPIGPTPQIVQALVAAKIDAGTGLFSHELQLKDNKEIVVITDMSRELPNMPRFGPVTYQEAIDRQSADVERFMIAHSAAWRWAVENRDAVINAAVKDLALPPPVAMGSFDAPLTREGMITPEFGISQAQFQQVQEMNLAAGLQSRPIPMEQAVDLRYVKAIADKLGPYKVPVKQ
jgi:ABC-type nitrate/sulfonate/bicarbonate transport system substrate-binding protein